MSGLDKMKARILEEAQSTARRLPTRRKRTRMRRFRPHGSQPRPRRQRSSSVRSATRQIMRLEWIPRWICRESRLSLPQSRK